MAISQAQYEKWITTEHLDVAEDYMAQAAPYVGMRFHKKRKLTASRPYIRHASREGMGPAVEFGEFEAPPQDKPIPGPEKVVWPVQVGLMGTITGRMVRNRESAKIKEIGTDLAKSMKVAMERKAHAWVLEGFTAGTTYTTADGVRVFATGHTRPGGSTYDTVLDVNLSFSWENVIAAIEHVRLTHKDGHGNPLNYFEGKILLITGEKLRQDVYEIFQPGKVPHSDHNTRNYPQTFNIEHILSPIILDKRWILMDAEGHMAVMAERLPTQVYTETVFSNRMNRTLAMAEYQNAVLEPWGLFGSEGPAGA